MKEKVQGKSINPSFCKKMEKHLTKSMCVEYNYTNHTIRKWYVDIELIDFIC